MNMMAIILNLIAYTVNAKLHYHGMNPLKVEMKMTN